MKLKGNTIEFLSTPSARRATIFIRSGMALLLFLSTPSARRATGASVAFDQYEGISIHALREEGDIAIIVEVIFEPDFYPRPPRGGRRRARPTRLEVIYFYPRPPRGGRLLSTLLSMRIASFLSTPSARRATCFGSNHPNLLLISIHALREEGDRWICSHR